MVRSGDQVEAGVLCGRENPDHLRRRSFHYRARERAAGIYKARAISDAPQQSGACAKHPGTDGAGRFVRARPRAMLADLKAELLAFPTGKHDDQVDELGLVGQLLDKWAPGGVPKIDFSPPPTDCL